MSRSNEAPAELLKTSEVARLLGVARSTVLSWAYRGFLSYVTTPGGHRRFPRDQVHALLTAGQQTPVPAPPGTDSASGPVDRPEGKEREVPVTDQQVAVVRALMTRDSEAYRRRLGELDREADRIGFMTVLCCCFIKAVERRFTRDGKVADISEIIEFVGDVRTRTAEIADKIDARVAEQIILCALDDGDIDDVDSKTFARVQALIVAALAADADLDDTEVEEFMAEVRPMADDWVDTYPDLQEDGR